MNYKCMRLTTSVYSITINDQYPLVYPSRVSKQISGWHRNGGYQTSSPDSNSEHKEVASYIDSYIDR